MIISILTFYAILVLVNIPAPFLGLEFNEGRKASLWYTPPGFLIPIVWFVLFALLGIARHHLIKPGLGSYQWWLYAPTLLLLHCHIAIVTLLQSYIGTATLLHWHIATLSSA